VLEKRVKRSGEEAYTCRSSEIETESEKGHIETEECIKGCGLNRKSFGISSDSLLEVGFTQNLCSPRCYQNCPNIVDLYFNLAAGEGNDIPPNVTRPIQSGFSILSHYMEHFEISIIFLKIELI